MGQKIHSFPLLTSSDAWGKSVIWSGVSSIIFPSPRTMALTGRRLPLSIASNTSCTDHGVSEMLSSSTSSRSTHEIVDLLRETDQVMAFLVLRAQSFWAMTPELGSPIWTSWPWDIFIYVQDSIRCWTAISTMTQMSHVHSHIILVHNVEALGTPPESLSASSTKSLNTTLHNKDKLWFACVYRICDWEYVLIDGREIQKVVSNLSIFWRTSSHYADIDSFAKSFACTRLISFCESS